MIAALRYQSQALLLGLVACQPASAGPGAGEADDARLTAIETKLDAITTKLDASTSSLEQLAAEAAARKALADELGARRQEHEQERGLRRSPDLADPFAAASASTGSREIDGASEGIECEGLETASTVCRIDRAFMTKVLADPSVLVKQARVVPFMRDDEVQGYKLYGIRAASLPKLLGLKNGDAITAVDGKPLDSLEAVMEVYEAIRTEKKSLSFELERRGAPLTLTLELVE